MLDVSFSELMLIGIVALVVIGPERLPKVARTAGHLFGRLQRYVSDVKADISREMQLDELKKLKSELQESARGFERSMSSEMQAIEKSASQAVESVSQELTPLIDDVTSAGTAGGAATDVATTTAPSGKLAGGENVPPVAAENPPKV